MRVNGRIGWTKYPLSVRKDREKGCVCWLILVVSVFVMVEILHAMLGLLPYFLIFGASFGSKQALLYRRLKIKKALNCLSFVKKP